MVANAGGFVKYFNIALHVFSRYSRMLPMKEKMTVFWIPVFDFPHGTLVLFYRIFKYFVTKSLLLKNPT
jgi:hypothetical protein